MRYYIFTLKDKSNLERALSKLNRKISKDSEGVSVTKINKGLENITFYGVIQTERKIHTDIFQLNLGYQSKDKTKISRKVFYCIFDINNNVLFLLSNSPYSSITAARQLMDEIAAIDDNNISIDHFNPSSQIITDLCLKFKGSGFNLKTGEWIYYGKGHKENIRIIGVTFNDIFNDSEIYELLDLKRFPMIQAKIMMTFPSFLHQDVYWNLLKEASYFTFSINPKRRIRIPLENYISIGKDCFSLLTEKDIKGFIQQMTLEEVPSEY